MAENETILLILGELRESKRMAEKAHEKLLGKVEMVCTRLDAMEQCKLQLARHEAELYGDGPGEGLTGRMDNLEDDRSKVKGAAWFAATMASITAFLVSFWDRVGGG